MWKEKTMDQSIEEKIAQTLAEIKLFFDQETTKLTAKKEEVMKATQNKLMIEQQQQELNKIKADLERREKELQNGIQLNRERTLALELKEKQYADKNERLKTTVRNLNLE